MSDGGGERVRDILAGRRLTRREFVAAVGAGAAATMLSRRVLAQAAPPPDAVNPQQAQVEGAGMDGDAYQPVRLPPKSDARSQLTNQQRDAVERQLSCPCPCTLDVFTCRTSMSCGFSPRMHLDVARLVDGGYTGDEILAAFKAAYGEQALMAPEKRGFNLVGYAMPFAAVGAGGVVIAALIRRWGARARLARAAAAARPLDVQATPEEMARLQAALRRDDDA